MNIQLKPLYRKVSKTTHNGFPHADYDSNPRSRNSRHTKKGMKRGMNTQQDSRGHGLYDYTPLFKFLLKQEGRDWSEVWKECVARLNWTEPITYMVINIRKNGLVNENIEIDTSVSGVGMYGKCFYNNKSFGYGEGSEYSTMYVDENNKLRFVDKNYKSGPCYECERRWGETFNGELYETYKRPANKVKKMKTYIKK
jgi:hypothetical protein